MEKVAARRGRQQSNENSALACPTTQIAAIDFIGENRGLSNLPNEAGRQKSETPGASGNATEGDRKAASFKTEIYRNRAESATALCHAIADCHPDDAVLIMCAAIESFSAGSPEPPAPWTPLIEEARDWCSWANLFEIKAYALACFEAMPDATRARFTSYVGRAAA